MKKCVKMFTIGACTLLLCGCGEIPKLSDGSEAVVNFKDLEGVSANEIYQQMKETYGLDALLTLMDTKILEHEYPDDLETLKNNAKSAVDSMINTVGKDQIEAYYGSTDNYQNAIYLSSLQQKAILDYAKTLVSDKEKQSYYDKNIYGDVKVSHILIETGVTSDTSSEDKTKLETEAKNKVNDIIKKLDEADDKFAKFKELAKEYSADAATKDNGGDLGSINTNTLSSQYDELLKAARELKDGEYSKSVITTELGYHVIYRESSSEKPSFEDKKDEITESLANQKISEDATIRVTAMDELRKKYDMDIKDEDIKKQYSNYIANQIASAKGTTSN